MNDFLLEDTRFWNNVPRATVAAPSFESYFKNLNLNKALGILYNVLRYTGGLFNSLDSCILENTSASMCKLIHFTPMIFFYFYFGLGSIAYGIGRIKREIECRYIRMLLDQLYHFVLFLSLLKHYFTLVLQCIKYFSSRSLLQGMLA